VPIAEIPLMNTNIEVITEPSSQTVEAPIEGKLENF
jgi:hypothetical protein